MLPSYVTDLASVDADATEVCGPITSVFTVEVDGSDLAEVPSFISADTFFNTVYVSSTDSNDRGTYILKMVHTLDYAPDTVTMTEILTTLTVTDTCVDGNSFVVTPAEDDVAVVQEFIIQTGEGI